MTGNRYLYNKEEFMEYSHQYENLKCDSIQ